MRYGKLACRACARTGSDPAAAIEKGATTESRLLIRSSLDRNERAQKTEIVGQRTRPSTPADGQPTPKRAGRIDVCQTEGARMTALGGGNSKITG
jgi:hypothetical protein